ncbi:hypothetical protein ACVNT8_004221 [Enterobacter cloacae]
MSQNVIEGKYDDIIGNVVKDLRAERIPVTRDSLLCQLYAFLISENHGFNEVAVRGATLVISSAVASLPYLSPENCTGASGG